MCVCKGSSPLKVEPWCHIRNGRWVKEEKEKEAREPIPVYDMANESTWESLHERREVGSRREEGGDHHLLYNNTFYFMEELLFFVCCVCVCVCAVPNTLESYKSP